MESLEDRDIRKAACKIQNYYQIIEILHWKYPKNILFEWWNLCESEYLKIHHEEITDSYANKINWEIIINEDWVLLSIKNWTCSRWNIKNFMTKCNSCKLNENCLWYSIYYKTRKASLWK